MRSLYTQLTLAAIAASVTARTITKSVTKSITVEEDTGSSNIYYVGCEPGNAIADCTNGITDTGCMEDDTTCSNGTDSGDGTTPSDNSSTPPSTGTGATPPSTGPGVNEPTTPQLNNDRSNLMNLTPGVCESIISE